MSCGIGSCLGYVNPRISSPTGNMDFSLETENPVKARFSSPPTSPLQRYGIKNGRENADEDTRYSPTIKERRIIPITHHR